MPKVPVCQLGIIKNVVKGKYHDVYPATDLDLLDAAIERILKRYAFKS